MTKSSKAIAIALLAPVATIGGMFFSTAPAQAATSSGPARHLVLNAANAASPATCSPKVDEELNGVWGNTCGYGFLSLYGENYVNAVRSPSAPYHRIWFHQIADGGGLTACFYSTGQDIYPADYVAEYGAWVEYPGDIQVSANTSPC